MNTRKTFFCIFSVLSILIIASCKNPLIPSPLLNNENNTGGDSSLLGKIPQNLTASQGLYKKISLTWVGVHGAERYYIYSADTPFSQYRQIAETQSNKTSIDLSVEPGADAYYRVTAFLRNNEMSSPSTSVRGTSLAVPLISSIEQKTSEEDTSVTVYWWMSNAQAYQKDVLYAVNCLNPDGTSAVQPQTVDGSKTQETKAEFNNLKPNTNYLFFVEAYHRDFQADAEKSLKVDASTARRMRPNPPENLSAGEGKDRESIKLSFTLPDMVDVPLGNKVFKPHPLYFKVYRRINETDEYVLIKDQLRPKPASPYINPAKPSYDELEAAYKPGAILSWEDDGNEDPTKDLERGLKYMYKVQAHADGISRDISSNMSWAQTLGWARAEPLFSVKTYVPVTDNPATRYKEGSLNFAFTWDAMGKEADYAFVLSEKRYKLEIDNTPANTPDIIGEDAKLTKFASIAEVNAYIRKFEIPPSTDLPELKKVRGYYEYRLYLVPAALTLNLGQSSIPAADTKEDLPALTRVLVTDDLNSPKIENFNFTVKDGYKDKFELLWIHDSTCTYEIDWYKAGEPKTTITDFASAIPAGTPNGALITYVHNAQSGDRGSFVLRIKKTINVESPAKPAETLGKPKLSFDSTKPEYNVISISWKETQKAAKYELIFKNDTEILLPKISVLKKPDGSYETDANTAAVLNYDPVLKLIKFTLNKPKGFDDALQSGKDINVDIEAISINAETNTKLDATGANIITRTLGPALTAAKATEAESNNKITLTWNKVEGAAGYIIKRERKSLPLQNTVLSSTIYFVPAEGTPISANSQETDTSRVSVIPPSDGQLRFTLEDKYVQIPPPDQNPTSWHSDQDKLAWGFPFTYTVLPVRSAADFDAGSAALSGIVYKNTNKVSAVGSALGYGHLVTATKAESPSEVVIEWTEPFLGTRTGLTPSLWKKESANSAAAWQKTDTALDGSGKKFVFKPKKANNELVTAYDFIVNYKEADDPPHQTFVAELAKSAADDAQKEASNKGYVFSLDFTAQNVPENGKPGFSEKLSWNLYDSAKRKRGPDTGQTYALFIKNADYSTDWQQIASIAQDSLINLTNKPDFQVNMTKAEKNITITPQMTDNTHSGLLQVFKDYRHFAKIEIKRTNSKGELITASCAEDSENYYTYRQISDKEFAIMITMAITKGIKDALGSSKNWKINKNTNTNPQIKSDGFVKNWDFIFSPYKPHCLTISGHIHAITDAVHQYPTHYGASQKFVYVPAGYKKTVLIDVLTVSGPAELNGLYSGDLIISDLSKNGSGVLKVRRNGLDSIHLGNITPLPFKGSDYLPINDWSSAEGWK